MTNFNKLTDVRSLNSTDLRVGDKVKISNEKCLMMGSIGKIAYIIDRESKNYAVHFNDGLGTFEYYYDLNDLSLVEDKPETKQPSVYIEAAELLTQEGIKKVCDDSKYIHKPQKKTIKLRLYKGNLGYIAFTPDEKEFENYNNNLIKEIEVELPEEEPETLSDKIEITGDNFSVIHKVDVKEFISKILEIAEDVNITEAEKSRQIKKLSGEKLLN